ncbi:transglycosylase domain-containing protein [Hymenobacter sp. 5317J-9]|uniref:transglycosylase domain-containing protein n=1 Tax=Hymenobacter sp. 5317J-9 TaxID=2932250 RepID=UPI001FD6792F|nr:biosynthetic peptidoglycan transglycosylase [Hymenobacter sp. 5317J-9]UOQ99446.1 transglycosylase domain-containing protein [Hymenobacter sp. 5317J-9]
MRISPSTKRLLFGILGGLALLLLLAFAVFQWKRQQLLDYALKEVKAKVERKYPVILTLGPARFAGFKTVEIAGLGLVPTANPTDTLLTARRLQASLSVRSLFAGRPVFSDLQIITARLTPHKTATADNYGFLIKKQKPSATPRDTTKGTNYGLLLNQALETVFDNVPGEANFKDFTVSYASLRHTALLRMPELKIQDGDISGSLTATIDSVANQLGISGHIEPGDYALNAKVYGVGGSVQLPYVPRRFGALVSFDTVQVRLDSKDFDDDDTGGTLTVRGSLAARNFSLYHPKLAANEIEVKRGGLEFVAKLGRGTAALEKGSQITVNKIVLYPEISVRLKPSRAVSINVTSAETEANDFFASLPTGIFDEVRGTQGTGTLTYHMSGSLDMAQVDSLKFDSSLKGKNFKLTSFGEEDLNKLNTPFVQTVYNDKGDSVRTFVVGPANPDFVSYNEVSPYLIHAITTAEDPRFFTHKGFMEQAFVKSAIQNIKEHRFARGGSTLSMQLVKNVFLTRQKTVARKIEEALIVWLLENTRLASKQRMFEVYLNIIEWGPSKYRWPSGKRGVYGVKDAALFYYGKRPSELNLAESLYLASIIPKPKYARYSFDAYGDLRRSTRYFFRLIADIMATRGLITSNDRENLPYGLSLNGPARQYMHFSPRPDTTRATVAADSSQFEPLNLIDLLNTGAAAPDAGVNSNAADPDVPKPPK